MRLLIALVATALLSGCAVFSDRAKNLVGCAASPNPAACALREAAKSEAARDPIRASFEERNMAENINDPAELDRWCEDQRQEHGERTLADSGTYEEVCETLLGTLRAEQEPCPVCADPPAQPAFSATPIPNSKGGCEAAVDDLRAELAESESVLAETKRRGETCHANFEARISVNDCTYRGHTRAGHTALCVLTEAQAARLQANGE